MSKDHEDHQPQGAGGQRENGSPQNTPRRLEDVGVREARRLHQPDEDPDVDDEDKRRHRHGGLIR
jgi:hypothetical protein